MGARGDVAEDCALEVAGANPIVVNEDVVLLLRKVLPDRERPGEVGAAVADEDGLLDTLLIRLLSIQPGFYSSFPKVHIVSSCGRVRQTSRPER